MKFWVALFIFLSSHSLISRFGLRSFIVKKLGQKAYFISYSVLSILLLTWLIITAQNSQRTSLWPWIHELYWVPNIFMPFACVLLISGFITPNPVSLIPKSKGFNPSNPSFIIAITRHPILWGFFLWSTSHIIPNGEYPLAIMFFVFSVFSILGIIITDKKFKKELGNKKWNETIRNTSSILFKSPSLWRGHFHFTKYDYISIIAGLLSYFFIYQLHDQLFGINPTPPL